MKVRKNKKGFTLIELLAVIVILGLLMAIAIPSVTKYITQSRKKTLTTTIGNYTSALTTQVNDMEYTFTATDTIYAVPIECIALERGGTNPFGEWHQSNNSYWAYVLVQYDDKTSSYTYGFTFKDSAGYGLYPTASEKLKESGSQINTDLDLTRPTNGTITDITPKANWSGFNVNDDTDLVVLQPTSEGETGNGQTTCTLCQKGKNYDQVKPIAQGTLGEVTWILSNDGTLTISGNGAIPNMTSSTAWLAYKTQIKNVVIGNGITKIGNYAFRDCTLLANIRIPASVISIGSYAFSGCSSLETVYYKGTTAPNCTSNAFSGTGVSLVNVPTDYSETKFCSYNVTK